MASGASADEQVVFKSRRFIPTFAEFTIGKWRYLPAPDSRTSRVFDEFSIGLKRFGEKDVRRLTFIGIQPASSGFGYPGL
ncbi:hypothetical protein SAMN05421764_103463 [Donghicola eburneus]|nr:hypothetical protein SAMN05421764_103463 [Donghicola eburneus]